MTTGKRLGLTALRCALPLLFHAAIVSGQAAWVAAVLSLAWLLFAVPNAVRHTGLRRLAWLAVSVAVPALLAATRHRFEPAVLIYGFPVVVFSLLLWGFGRSLVPGREPLVTRIARLERGELSPELARYTRSVTALWAAFFALMVVESVLLAVFAPIETWSLFANVLNYVFVVALFAGEYAYRRVRLPQYTHSSPLRAIRRFVQSHQSGA